MMSTEQEQLLNDLAQRLVVLDGRVYLAQQACSGQAPAHRHLLEMQNCVRQMIQRVQSMRQCEPAGALVEG